MLSFAPSSTIRVDRRKFLGGATALIAAGLLPRSVLALAAPYSFKQGAYDCTVVSDGTLLLKISQVLGEDPQDEVKKLLGVAADSDEFKPEENALLLKSGSDVILIDTGTGGAMGDTNGKIVESLKSAGTDPATITKVIYTHAHPDHLWGTIGKDGAKTFPNASYLAAETEFNFWTMPDLASKMPKGMEQMVTATAGQLAAIKDKVTLFKPGAEIAPGIAAIDTNGHTPGHVSFELSGGDGLIVAGDVFPSASVFFPHPEWKFGFDADHANAAASRKKLLEMASAGKKKMLGYHWPYPGLGFAEAKDGAYAFVPAS